MRMRRLMAWGLLLAMINVFVVDVVGVWAQYPGYPAYGAWGGGTPWGAPPGTPGSPYPPPTFGGVGGLLNFPGDPNANPYRFGLPNVFGAPQYPATGAQGGSTGRYCAAEAQWQRMQPAPRPGTPFLMTVGVPPVRPGQDGTPGAVADPSRPRVEGVGSISVQDMTSSLPPQQRLIPAVDSARALATMPADPVAPPLRAPTPPAQNQADPRTKTDTPSAPGAGTRPTTPGASGMSDILSPIEIGFGDLRQFGYTLFAFPPSTFAPVEDVPVGPDYIVGPGDRMVINVSGVTDEHIERQVDRNGRIILPRVGPVRVWGLPFAEADRLIRSELGRYFRGFSTTVTMGALRTIRVHVVGEVCQPGSYTVSSLATLTNALFAAGGPSRLGSLREVRLNRNGETVGTLDLYDFMLRGDRSRDLRLQSGDTIFVPTIGSVVGVEGEVKRPAIYEVRGSVRVSDLIMVAGGVTPRSYLRRVQLIRQQASAGRSVMDIDLTSVLIKGDTTADVEVQNGDLVRVFASDFRTYNVVHVSGAVKYPGDYELRDRMRISQLLPPDSLLPEAQAKQVEVVRHGGNLSTEVLSIDLELAWKGSPDADVELRQLDEVKVRTELRARATVTLEGELKRPGQYSIVPGERLSSVLRRAGGFTERAYARGAVFTRMSLRAKEHEQVTTFVQQQEERLTAAAAQTVVTGVDRIESAVNPQVLQARRELLRVMASRVVLGRMVVRIDDPDTLERTSDDVILEDGDTIQIPLQPASVLVVGSVRNATSVQYKPNGDVEYYVNRVGGFSKEADKKEIHIVKADGSAVSGFNKIRSVEPGDTIIVPPEEADKIRYASFFRDAVSVLSSVLLGITSLAVISILF